MSERRTYYTDLTDSEWQKVKRWVPPVKRGGRPAEHLRREIVNASLYVLHTGCQWHMLPHDLPSWKTVYTYFRIWRSDGTWERIEQELCNSQRRGKSNPLPAEVGKPVLKRRKKRAPRLLDF